MQLSEAAGAATNESIGLVKFLEHLISILINMDKMFSMTIRRDSIAAEYIQTAGILFCTLTTSGNEKAKLFSELEVLIVDEAAQVFEPELLIPLARCPSHLVMIGTIIRCYCAVSPPFLRRSNATTSHFNVSSH